MVSWAGKLTSRNTLPTAAGLKGLAPVPPYTCLPRTMAMTPPTKPTQRGAWGGSVRARIKPVTSDETSPVHGLLRRAKEAASASTAPIQVTRVRMST